MAARIIGVGKYLPERIMTNQELEGMVDTSDQWIVERTGIRERRIAADDEGCASLGAEAARMAVRTAGLLPADIDLVICATCTPDGFMPASASLIQHAIGATRAAAFDINAVCTGFVVALATATQFINAGVYERVLVVGSEVVSRILNWQDRGTCILFGDGAGAVVLERGESGGAGSFVLKSDGAGAGLLYAPGPAAAPVSPLEAEGYFVNMDGREVFKFAVRAMDEVVRQSASLAGISVSDIDYVIPHQANQRIIVAAAKSLGVPEERLVSNLSRYGNTSSATIPIALCETWEEGRLHEGDNLMLVAFGAGLTWGAGLVQWSGLGSKLRRRREVAASFLLS